MFTLPDHPTSCYYMYMYINRTTDFKISVLFTILKKSYYGIDNSCSAFKGAREFLKPFMRTACGCYVNRMRPLVIVRIL